MVLDSVFSIKPKGFYFSAALGNMLYSDCLFQAVYFLSYVTIPPLYHFNRLELKLTGALLAQHNQSMQYFTEAEADN